MSTLTIELTEELRAFVDAQVTEQGFASAGEFVSDLIRREHTRRAKQALDALLLEGLNSPTSEMTREDWQSLERAVWERHDRDQKAS